jgi:cytochrome b involved in lipid metabolism
VYDLTPWLDKHPGGRQALLNRGGKDADEDFAFHSARGQALWNSACIGRLVACPARPHVTSHQTCALV